MGKKINSYIFITTEGFTFQPNSESIESDIANCQVIGFAEGENEQQAFENLIRENNYLMDTAFDEVLCYQLKDKRKTYFRLDTKTV